MGLTHRSPCLVETTALGTWEGGYLEAGPWCRPWFAAYGRASPADLHEPSLSHPIGYHSAAHLSMWLYTLKFHEDFVYMYKKKSPKQPK